MGQKVKTIIAIALPLQVILVKWLANYPGLVEEYYSNGIYPYISQFLRILFGWVPFSVGDIFYTLLAFLALRYIYKNHRFIRKRPLQFLKDMVVVLSIAYFTFHLFWGLNYYRQPITWKLQIEKEYTMEELVSVNEYLIEKVNEYQVQITRDTTNMVKIPYLRKEIFKKTKEGYSNLSSHYPDFEYKTSSLKASLYSLPLTYMGYGGYLNPFSNEAQVNGLMPASRLPTVSGHEVGHQLGYSAEDATNLIGFLVTIKNDDIYFKYTAYSHALGYCLSDLLRKDEVKFRELFEKLNPGVKKNFKEISEFWEQYANPLEPVFKSVFSAFLKANNQQEGIQSYNSVVGLVINYHEKYGF